MATNSTSPRVGIFMPCYNLGEYIEEAIDSLKQQTFQDFEVIIADDASPDSKTISKLKSLDLPANYRLTFEKKNLGMNRITNKHARKLKNQYFLVFSADDTLEPGFLKETVKYLDSNPDISVAATWANLFGDDEGSIEINEEGFTPPNMLLKNGYIGSSLIRKVSWDKYGGYNESPGFRNAQDYELWIKFLDNNENLGVVKRQLFNYRVRGGSLSRSNQDLDNRVRVLTQLIEAHPKIYSEHMPALITKLLADKQQAQDEWQELHDGHEWLDKEYHKLLHNYQSLTTELQTYRRYLQPLERAKGFLKKLYPF